MTDKKIDIIDTIRDIEASVLCINESLHEIKYDISGSSYIKKLAYSMIAIDSTIEMLDRINKDLRKEFLKQATKKSEKHD